MVEIMLAVMLLAIDLARLHVLRVFDAPCFPFRDGAVGSGLLFHCADARLALLEPRGFALRQRAGLLTFPLSAQVRDQGLWMHGQAPTTRIESTP